MKDNNKRIVFVARGLGLGGAQKVLVFVANACSNQGYDVKIISLSDNKNTLNINENIHIHTIGYDSSAVNKLNIFLSSLYKAKLIFKLRKKIKELNPSLIVAFMSDIVRIVVIAAKGLGIKIIGSERSNPLVYSSNQFKKYSNAYRCCDSIVFQTKRAAQMFQNDIQEKSIVIENPSIPRGNEIKPYEGERRKVIVSAGRLCRQKRFDVLIYAFIKVLDKYPDYKLEIFGEGPEKDKLEEIIKNHNLQKSIILEGASKDVFRYAYDAAAFVLSSDYEGIPNVLIEALSVGLPCISTDCEPGGPRLLLDEGRRGILVPTGNVEEMYKAICTYIENPELAKEFSKLAIEVNDEFRPDIIEKKWLNLIDNVLSSKRDR